MAVTDDQAMNYTFYMYYFNSHGKLMRKCCYPLISQAGN